MLDIRYPIGGMFVVLGIILVIFGFASDPTIYQIHSGGVNVNIGWGCVLLVFGGFMLTMARRARQRTQDIEPPPGMSPSREKKTSSSLKETS
jgi:hypothetical protein